MRVMYMHVHHYCMWDHNTKNCMYIYIISDFVRHAMDRPKAFGLHRCGYHKSHVPWTLHLPESNLLSTCWQLHLGPDMVVMFRLLLCTYLAIAFNDCVVQPSAAYA